MTHSSLPQGVFVTGTDTGVGKTLACATLVRAWQSAYWKPLQTGTDDGDDDTARVAELAQLPADYLLPPGRQYRYPASPDYAARLENTRVEVAQLPLPQHQRPIVVEGAGGVLVPINDRETMLDLIAALGLPCVVVARSGLGTINHTLLTLEALRRRGQQVAGLILSGPSAPHNRADLERYGQVRVLLEIPPLGRVTPQIISDLAQTVAPLESL